MNIIGTDVSFYQDAPTTPGQIDFNKMKSSGASFTIIRAGQNTWVDSDLAYNMREAKLAGLPRGTYWYYDSRTDPKTQARLYISALNGDLGELPLWADLEERYGGPYGGWKHWYTFLEELKLLAPGKEIGIYTAPYYWMEFAPNATLNTASFQYFKQYPLWIANYTTAAQPMMVKPWDNWTFWQYTEKGDGLAMGVESLNIDMNYFNGDMSAFNTRFGLTASEPPVVVTPPVTDRFCYVKYDYDQQWPDFNNIYHVSRPTRNKAASRVESLPATAIFRNNRQSVPMTRDIQEWIHGMCWAGSPTMPVSEAKKSFYSLFRDDAYATNFAGTTTRADYINGTNLNKGLPLLIPMVCGGATLKIVGERRIGTEDCWAIETIDSTKSYRDFNPIAHPHLFYRPTNSARRKIMRTNALGVKVWTGKWTEIFSNPFSQYREKAIVPIMTVGTNVAYIPKWRVKVLLNGEKAPGLTRG